MYVWFVFMCYLCGVCLLCVCSFLVCGCVVCLCVWCVLLCKSVRCACECLVCEYMSVGCVLCVCCVLCDCACVAFGSFIYVVCCGVYIVCVRNVFLVCV